MEPEFGDKELPVGTLDKPVAGYPYFLATAGKKG